MKNKYNRRILIKPQNISNSVSYPQTDIPNELSLYTENQYKLNEKVLLAQISHGLYNKKQPLITAGKLVELENFNKSPTNENTQDFQYSYENIGRKKPILSKNIEKLLRNRKKLADVPVPNIFPGYKELVHGMTPAKIESLITQKHEENNEIMPKINTSFQFEYCDTENPCFYNNVENKGKTVPNSVKLTARKNISKILHLHNKKELPLTLKENLKKLISNKTSISPKNTKNLPLRHKKWILILENSTDFTHSKKFLYNLSGLFTKYGLTKNINENDCIQKRAFQDFLEQCSYFLSQNKTEYTKFYNLKGEQIMENILKLAENNILFALQNSENFCPLSEAQISDLHDFIESDENCMNKIYISEPNPQHRSSQLSEYQNLFRKDPEKYKRKSLHKASKSYSQSTSFDTKILRLPNISNRNTIIRHEIENKNNGNSRTVCKILKGLQEKFNFTQEIYYDLLSQYNCLLKIDSLCGNQKNSHKYCISPTTIKKYTEILNAKHKKSVKTIFKNLDAYCKCRKITIEGFVKLKLFLKHEEYFPKDYIIDFWLKIIDPYHKQILPISEVLINLENFARNGYFVNQTSQNSATLSAEYSEKICKIFRKLSCIDEKENIVTKKIEENMLNGKFNIEDLKEGLK